MRKLLLLLLAAPLCAQTLTQHQIPTKDQNDAAYLPVSASSNWLSGTATYTALQTALTACGTSPCAIRVTGNIAPTANLTIPANVKLYFDGGQISPAISTVTTINGPISDTTLQIFSGAGTIAGLKYARPEWFPLGTYTEPVIANAVNACATGGCYIPLQLSSVTHYRSGYDMTIGGTITWMQHANVSIVGAGRPVYNGGFTQLSGGSIIDGAFYVGQGSSGFRIEHVGVDTGSVVMAAFYSGYSTLDSLSITSALPGDPTHYTNLSNILVNDVACLGFSRTSADHCMLVENVDNSTVSNVATVMHTHGLVLKGTNIAVKGLYARGSASDDLIIKSDTYSPTQNVIVQAAILAALTTAGDSGGLVLGGGGSAMSNLRLDVSVDNTQFGASFQGNSAISDVHFTHFAYNAETTGGQCFLTTSSASLASFTFDRLDCENGYGFTMTNPILNLTISSGYFGAMLGNPITISGAGYANISNVVINSVTAGGGINVQNTAYVNASNITFTAVTGDCFDFANTAHGNLSNIQVNGCTGYGVNNSGAGQVNIGNLVGAGATGTATGSNLYFRPTIYLGSSSPAINPVLKTVSCTAVSGTCSVTFTPAFPSAIDHCYPTLTLGGIAVGTAEPAVWVSSATASAVTFNTSSGTFAGTITATCWGN